MTIQENAVVTLEYTLTDENNTILDSTKDRELFSYIHGGGMIIPGLESALTGKTKGDAFDVTIQPEDAYGEARPDLVQSVPKEHFSHVPDVQVGMQFEIQSNEMRQVVTVAEVNDDEVTIDANHPLAGRTLHFDVQVADVREATPEELDHGHVHD